LVVVLAINCTMTRQDVSGRPRQLIAMKLKRRCSIWFHWDVPVRKCATVIPSPVSLANLAKPTFPARIR